MASLERAIAIAASAHSGQMDKAGKPYILHPLRVMLCMDSVPAMIVAVLHDVVEDTSCSMEVLRGEGFSEEVLECVATLTHGPGEDYFDYVQRIRRFPLARAVKLADLEDNMNLSRLPHPTETDLERVEKYKRAQSILVEHRGI